MPQASCTECHRSRRGHAGLGSPASQAVVIGIVLAIWRVVLRESRTRAGSATGHHAVFGRSVTAKHARSRVPAVLRQTLFRRCTPGRADVALALRDGGARKLLARQSGFVGRRIAMPNRDVRIRDGTDAMSGSPKPGSGDAKGRWCKGPSTSGDISRRCCWGERIASDKNPSSLTLIGAAGAWTDRVRCDDGRSLPKLHGPRHDWPKQACRRGHVSGGAG